MEKQKELKKYLNHEFSTGWDTGKDYKTFQNKYINYLRELCKECGWELVKINRNHYEFSVFFKYKENKYVYFAISDVRYFKNEWYYHILIRTAKDDNDYCGGQNNYTSLNTLTIDINNLFQRTGDI